MLYGIDVKCSCYGNGIDAEMPVKPAVFLIDKGFLYSRSYFFQFGVHAPFIIVGEKGGQHSAVFCFYDGGIISADRNRKQYTINAESEEIIPEMLKNNLV